MQAAETCNPGGDRTHSDPCVIKSSGTRVLRPIILASVEGGSVIHSGGYGSYKTLPHYGYDHRTTNHSAFEFYTPESYTQNIENFWLHLKRGIKGVHRHVNPASFSSAQRNGLFFAICFSTPKNYFLVDCFLSWTLIDSVIDY